MYKPTHTCLLPSFSQTVSTASELRKPIYWIVAAKAIDYEQMLLLMAGVKWDIREIMSQHNVYVDVLLKVILHKKWIGDVCLNNDYIQRLWFVSDRNWVIKATLITHNTKIALCFGCLLLM